MGIHKTAHEFIFLKLPEPIRELSSLVKGRTFNESILRRKLISLVKA